MKQLLITLALVLCSTPALAVKSYTSDQLNEMIDRDHYPAQGPIHSKELEDMYWFTCLVSIQDIASQLSAKFNTPTKVVINTDIIVVSKTWLPYMVVMLSCSRPDQKLLTTTATYR